MHLLIFQNFEEKGDKTKKMLEMALKIRTIEKYSVESALLS